MLPWCQIRNDCSVRHDTAILAGSSSYQEVPSHHHTNHTHKLLFKAAEVRSLTRQRHGAVSFGKPMAGQDHGF
jgi:hypothetical protein